jgi:DNA repair protein RadC
MTTKIADLPLDEQPRERIARYGVETLSDAELVSVVLSTSRGRNTIEVARSVLSDGLLALAKRDWRSYARVTGIGEANATKIAACFELGRRTVIRETPLEDPITNPESLARALIARYGYHVQERLGAVYLDAKNRVILEREIFIGTLNSATVSTRDVLRYALDTHAASVIVFHNHPSGDPAPSAEDLLFTRKLVEAGKTLCVDVVDHLILGTSRYVSLKQRGML